MVFLNKVFLYSWRTDLRSVLLFAYRFCWVPRTKRFVDPWLGCCSKWAGEQFSLNSFGTKPAQIDITCSFYALLNWKASSIMNLQSFFYRWTTMIRTIFPLAIWMILTGENNCVDQVQSISFEHFGHKRIPSVKPSTQNRKIVITSLWVVMLGFSRDNLMIGPYL